MLNEKWKCCDGYGGNFTSFYFYAVLSNTLMKMFSDSTHALVTAVTATTPLLLVVVSVKLAVGELLDKHDAKRVDSSETKEYLGQPSRIKF